MSKNHTTYVSTYSHEIENPQAYDAAVAANIKRNASKTRAKKWLAVEGNERLKDWLFLIGEFAPQTKCYSRTYDEHMLENPLLRQADHGVQLL